MAKTSIASRFPKSVEKYCEALKKMRKDCIAYLKYVLKFYGEVKFNFDYDEQNICISYDGGNHPEYASNCYSTVYRVYRGNDGEICLEIEDSSAYELDRVSTEDLVCICEAIQDSYIPMLEETPDDPEDED